MKNIFFIHWNEEELLEKIKPLKNEGYKVSFHFTSGIAAKIGTPIPDILIICLDRLPSHGKAYAEWLWQSKKRQTIPIIFCGGDEEKLVSIKTKFAKALFCSNDKLLLTLDKLKRK